MSRTELTGKAKDYREIMAMIKELQDEADTIKAVITAEMEPQGADTLQADIFTIKWTEYTTKRIDTTRLKKDYPGIAAEFTKATTARRFQVA